MSSVDVIDSTVQKSHEWLNWLMEELHTEDKHYAYTVFRSVMHALRDRLQPQEAVHLGAQLPMLLRGMYYEGWRPTETPSTERNRAEFLEKIEAANPRRTDFNPDFAARAVFSLLCERVSIGEIEDILGTLPQDIREFWPTQTTRPRVGR